MASLPIYLITCSSPHRTSKYGDIMHLSGHLLLTLGADINSNGFLFKATIYQFLGCYSCHGLNYQELFLCHQLISIALHGSSFHHVTVYIFYSIEYIILLPKSKIPPDITICLDSEVHMHKFRIFLHRRTEILHYCSILLQIATKIFASF